MRILAIGRHYAGSMLVVSLFLATGLATAAKVDKVIAEEEARTNAAAKSQTRIDAVSDQTYDIVGDYKSVLKINEGLDVYNGLLQKQLDDQNAEIAQIQKSIQDVSLIERQIIPLMVRMIDTLEQFVQLDIPFLLKEREKRVRSLREMMERADVTVAEKFRRVIEAYQIEGEYGRTIEAYKGVVTIEGKEKEVDFLRIGRTAALYQTVGKDATGAWNKQTGQWETLPPEIYRNQVSKGLRVARKQIAPDLLILPIDAPETAK